MLAHFQRLTSPLCLGVHMDETTKEIAKTTSKALEVAEKVGSFLGTVLGDAFKEVGASIHDWAKFYRYKNLLKINDKVIQLHKERGIQGKSVPIQPSIGIPLIQAASLSEDENLQQKWATLIANATDPNYKDKIRKSYIDILSSLDPSDALVLDWMAAQGWNNELGEITIKIITENLNLSETDAKISSSNLNRLGLIDFGVPTTVGSIGISASGNETRFKLNQLGWALLKLCEDKA